MSRYAVGDRVSVILTFTPRRTATGVVASLPGDALWYGVDVDGIRMHFPVDEILGPLPPENVTPAEMVAWLRS